VARVRLGLGVDKVVPTGLVVIGLDDTVERRRGEQSKATGISRDPVRSARSQRVKASRWRWLCAMVVAEIPWAGRVWGLPFLTALYGLCIIIIHLLSVLQRGDRGSRSESAPPQGCSG